jgi:hypothetical protein
MNNQIALLLLDADDEADEDYELVEDCVDCGHSKHDYTNYYSIYLHLPDDTYWKVSFRSSYDSGIDGDSISTRQVKKKEVIKTIWVGVP